MKNLINQFYNAATVCCFVCAAFGADAQIVNIPDANFRNALFNTLCVDTDNFNGGDASADRNNDGIIQASEALYVTSLDVSSQNITDLTGIERFTNIRRFYCSYNNLMNLNLQPLTRLTDLYCGNNPFTNLNLQYSTNLKVLNCTNSQLFTLNIQNLLNLDDVDCSVGRLSSINMQGSVNITYLTCTDNQLVSLNLQDVPSMRALRCYNNKIESLNAQGLVSLTGLYLYNNKLVSLNVQGASSLVYLDCNNNLLNSLNVQALSNLKFLYCFDNKLTILNVQGLTNLRDFTCGSNQLAYMNVQGLNQLSYFDCSYNPIACLSQLPNSLQILDIDSTNIICLPNQPSGLVNGTGAFLPLCQAGNTNNCYVATTNSAASANAALRVSPNPMRDATIFELTDAPAFGSANSATLLVYNTIGQAVRTVSFEGNKCTFVRDALPTGCYFYSVQSGADVLNKGKLVIE